MANIFQTLKGIFGFGKQEVRVNSIEQMIQSGKFVELTAEEAQLIVAPGVVEEVKMERNLIEVLSNKIERKEGFNKLFHSAIVKLSDGEVINTQNVSGDTAVKVGYHPAGYSIWNEQVEALEDGTFSITWNSFNTCD